MGFGQWIHEKVIARIRGRKDFVRDHILDLAETEVVIGTAIVHEQTLAGYEAYATELEVAGDKVSAAVVRGIVARIRAGEDPLSVIPAAAPCLPAAPANPALQAPATNGQTTGKRGAKKALPPAPQSPSAADPYAPPPPPYT